MNKLQLSLKKHSPLMLSIISSIGVIATAGLAIQATPKALKIIEAKKEEKGEELTKVEVLQCTWKTYVPMALSGFSTILCIFGTHYLNSKRQANLLLAYASLQKTYQEYVKKVDELYPDNHIQEEIAKSKFEAVRDDFSLDNDKILFYDYQSGRYFESSINNVMSAEETLNSEFAAAGWVTVNEFYKFLGIQPLAEMDDYGWISDGNYFELTFTHKLVQMDDGLECYILTMDIPPRFFI